MSSSATSAGGGNSKNPFAWLGLLKWSLSYADGTRDETPAPMSAEDKAFLEKVMAEGIINEGDRMQEILKSVTDVMTEWKTTPWTPEQADETEGWLQELRDIVEQIDYARAFSSMKGSVFLLGCIQERDHVPRSTRMLCLGILATMVANNPPIQKELLELGALKTLSDVYFQEEQDSSASDENGKLRARIIQALSAAIRSHDLAEQVFCQTEQAVSLLESGLGVDRGDDDTATVLRQRSLFLLRALLTSDSSTRDRMVQFARSLGFVLDTFTAAEQDDQLREMSVALLQQILEQKKCVNIVLQRKNALVARGVQRVAALRALTGEDKDYVAVELEHWEAILVLLARAVPDSPVDDAAPPLMLPPSDTPNLPQ
uniref:Nucleotide exchange factor Fes1 domain-containing protein n=1 Tax=Amphora coffeiformis TaxID=265554 RepID=A0A7S3L3I3_9STRA|mmetsp:Transcript_5217/g.10288  ORF Transcript_5217/g.10288 Transcript_5217/m.10288 type:complete len:372 (+) Transcript_5217:71-1186(+)